MLFDEMLEPAGTVIKASGRSWKESEHEVFLETIPGKLNQSAAVDEQARHNKSTAKAVATNNLAVK